MRMCDTIYTRPFSGLSTRLCFILLSFLISLPAYLHVSKTIEACRVHLFDVVTQYKAIFPDDDSVLVGIRGGSSQQFEGALFCGWLNSKVGSTSFLLKFIP